jgi:hypothetical protein
MAEVETAVALTRAAARSGSDLTKAQARVWASDVSISVATRLLKLFAASGVPGAPGLGELERSADLPGAMALAAGRLADMDFIAAAITRG